MLLSVSIRLVIPALILCLIFYAATMFTKGLPIRFIGIVLALLFVLYALNAHRRVGHPPAAPTNVFLRVTSPR